MSNDIARMSLPPMKTISLLTLSIALAFIVRVEAAENAVLRVGHFPNITHAQTLVAHNLSRQGKGWFEERLGPGDKDRVVRLQCRTEIYVTILTGFGLGHLLHYGRELQAMDQVIGVMLVIILIGLLTDKILFAPIERFLHRRWGTGLR
jgi:hypothetical protein